MAGLHMFPVGGVKPEACPIGGTLSLTLHRPGQLEQRRIMVSPGVKWVFWQFSICSSQLQDFRRLLVAHSTEKQCEGFRNPEINWSQLKDLFQDPMSYGVCVPQTASAKSILFTRSGPIPISVDPTSPVLTGGICCQWVGRLANRRCLASLSSSSGELTASHLLLFRLLHWVPAWLSSCSLAWLAFLTCCFPPHYLVPCPKVHGCPECGLVQMTP